MSPIYEFRCPSGHTQERMVPVMATTHDLERCAVCGADAARVISLPQRPIVKGGTPTHHPRRGR